MKVENLAERRLKERRELERTHPNFDYDMLCEDAECKELLGNPHMCLEAIYSIYMEKQTEGAEKYGSQITELPCNVVEHKKTTDSSESCRIRFCPVCGERIETSCIFCASCGYIFFTKINAEPKEETYSRDRDVLLVRRVNTALCLSHDIYPDICKYINNNNPEYLKLAFDPKLTTEEIYMILNPDDETAYLKTHPFARELDDALLVEKDRTEKEKKQREKELSDSKSSNRGCLVTVLLFGLLILFIALAIALDTDEWVPFILLAIIFAIVIGWCISTYHTDKHKYDNKPLNADLENRNMYADLLIDCDVYTKLGRPSVIMLNPKIHTIVGNRRFNSPKLYFHYKEIILRIVKKYDLFDRVRINWNNEQQLVDIISFYPPPCRQPLSYPWATQILTDIQEEYDKLKLARISNKALKAAEAIQQIKREKHELKAELSLVKNQLRVYESLFPWLEEFKELDISDAVKYASDTAYDEDYDEILRKYLSPEEYSKLSLTEKNQLALDRYKARKKTDWEVGIEYERYIGYLYERDGYLVEYTGAIEGVHDMGRDLIAKKGKTTYIIQCKRWNQNKTIHEKHIFQTYGTTMLKRIMNPGERYKAVFYTTTELSPLAAQCAQELKVTVHQNFPYDNDYPMIKCNIGKDENNQAVWIYHLPFDQQYNRVIIDYSKGERYVRTVKEAEALGFRRAYRHHHNAE